MGLSTAWHAAGSGLRVVVLERFAFGHHRGASHGGERIFRHAHTDRAYVEMALAADEGWRRLERSTGRQLIHRVGCVEHGPEAELDDLARVSTAAGVAVERLTAREAERRWPMLRFSGDTMFQPDGGWVAAAVALEVLADQAARRGATLLAETPVAEIDVAEGRARVRTPARTFVAPSVVVTPGAWASRLLPEMGLPTLTTTQEQVFYFRPAPRAATGASMPSFIHWDALTHYGLPGPGGLVKVGQHHTGAVTTGDDRTFTVDPTRRRQVAGYVSRWVPGLTPGAVSEDTCLYTSTPSLDFVLDRVGPIVVGCGFSGLGFKYVPEIGRRLAGLAAGDVAVRPFSLAWHTASAHDGS
jgi:sarcosine oxidase